MSAVILRQREAEPAAYPAAPTGLSTAAAALAPALVWQRLEAWIAYRWTERAVVWVIEGPGEFTPPLAPTEVDLAEVWSGADEWEEAELSASAAGGFWLPATGPYRFTARAGVGDSLEPPASVLEAYRRLAEYMAAPARAAGVTSEAVTVGGVTTRRSFSASWQANAIANCGAGDLLRPYRRAA